MAVGRLILGINLNGERFDGVHMQVGHLFDVTTLLLFRAPYLVEALFVEAIEHIDESDNQQTDEEERNAAVVQCGIEERGGCGTGDLRDGGPDQTLTRKPQ